MLFFRQGEKTAAKDAMSLSNHHKRLRIGLMNSLPQVIDLGHGQRTQQNAARLAGVHSFPWQSRHPATKIVENALGYLHFFIRDDDRQILTTMAMGHKPGTQAFLGEGDRFPPIFPKARQHRVKMPE
jgi:hypothetical protein